MSLHQKEMAGIKSTLVPTSRERDRERVRADPFMYKTGSRLYRTEMIVANKYHPPPVRFIIQTVN